MRAAARPLRAHAETGLSLPGALCVTTVTTGSQPEPSILFVHSSPDLVVVLRAKAVLERQQWLTVTMAESQMSKYQQRVSHINNAYPHMGLCSS